MSALPADAVLDEHARFAVPLAKHTPTPWVKLGTRNDGSACPSVWSGNADTQIAACSSHQLSWEGNSANATHIVRCVNALAELPPFALEGGWTYAGLRDAEHTERQRAKAKIDALMAALREARNVIGSGLVSPQAIDVVEQIDAALAASEAA